MDSNHAPHVNQRTEAAERDSVGLKSREPDNSASGGRLLTHSVDLMLSQVVGFFGLVDVPFPLSLRHHPPFSGSTNLPSSAPIVRNLVSRLSSTGYLEVGTLRKNMRIHTRYLRQEISHPHLQVPKRAPILPPAKNSHVCRPTISYCARA
ncbi:hypothetical protein PCASD_02788 [Puccinia coronata f. sp. avenae]|uniref:Uncharacterized protein n=1 Tax=Puccinia coronata f. sp. avenae TaxID=200324 RepID=A0A2N5VG18_9BASI|nr:hypothetical protein PCASD_02788 [Puccinia coronata f. sp. avenae]